MYVDFVNIMKAEAFDLCYFHGLMTWVWVDEEEKNTFLYVFYFEFWCCVVEDLDYGKQEKKKVIEYMKNLLLHTKSWQKHVVETFYESAMRGKLSREFGAESRVRVNINGAVGLMFYL